MRGFWFSAVLFLCACGGDDAPPDAAAPTPDAFFSICGFPGDQGNEMGVGKFCESLADCADTVDAPLCSDLGDPTSHFCTNTCSPDADAGPPSCGTGADCVCGEGGCGCTPVACL